MKGLLSICIITALFFITACPQPVVSDGPKPVQPQINAFETIRNRRVAFLTAVEASTKANYEQTAQKWAQSFNAQTTDFMLWSDLTNFENGVQIQSAYERINAVARVYALKTSTYYKSAEYLELIKTGLDFLHTHAYNSQKPEKGNWWQWEIGIPKILNDILILAYDGVQPEEKRQYLTVSRFFQPDPLYNGASTAASASSSPQKRASLGANLVDTASISFLRGVLLQDAQEVNTAIAALDGVNACVTAGEGFYADGSFMQHNIPYTGTYASVLFDGLGQLLYLAAGTEFDSIKNKMTVVYESILKSLPYLFINGGVTDSVSGRSIARGETSDLERGRALITSLALLADSAPTQYKNKLKTLLKTAIKGNTEYRLTDRVYNTIQKNILIQIADNAGVGVEEPIGGRIFLDMDRAVYKTDLGAAIVIAMHSNRVGNFEIMNGENLKGWHTGDGMTYLYGKNSRAYTDFWPTVDPYHLGGTTESDTPRPANPTGERRTAQKMSPAKQVGGAVSAKSLLAVMDFYSWNDKTRAKKTWFCTDNLMIALGSGITSTDSGNIQTTIENRISDTASSFPSSASKNTVFEIKDGSDVFSYKILEGQADLRTDTRTGSWKDIGGTLTEVVSKQYFTAIINHGTSPTNAKYAYIAAPLLTKTQLETASKKISILRHDEKAHGIQFDTTTAINFFAIGTGTVGIFAVNNPCSLIAEKHQDGYDLFVSDSAQTQTSLTITLSGNYTATSTEQITVAHKNSTTTVTIRNPTASTSKISLSIKN